MAAPRIPIFQRYDAAPRYGIMAWIFGGNRLLINDDIIQMIIMAFFEELGERLMAPEVMIL